MLRFLSWLAFRFGCVGVGWSAGFSVSSSGLVRLSSYNLELIRAGRLHNGTCFRSLTMAVSDQTSFRPTPMAGSGTLDADSIEKNTRIQDAVMHVIKAKETFH